MTIDIRVRIDEEERSLDSTDPNWVHRRLGGGCAPNGHRVQVLVHTEHVYVRLTTSNCPSSGVARSPTREEHDVLELWQRFRLGNPGANLLQHLWPFLMCLRSHLGLKAA